MIRLRFGYALAASLVLATLPSLALGQALVDDAITADQRAVGAVFDSAGSAAAPGSTLDTDYTRLLSGSPTEVRESTQSLLPTTAYSMTGAANALASTEERNVMGRLRTLRQGSSLAATKPTASRRSPVIAPLQNTDEHLHDLRTGKKAPTISSTQGTTNLYRNYYPSLYKDTTDRNLDRTRFQPVPEKLDQATTATLDYAGDLGGQGRAMATARNGMPRHVATTLSETQAQETQPQRYRGQPLSTVTTHSQPIQIYPPISVQTVGAPIQLTRSAQSPARPISAPPLTVIETPYNDPLNPPPPVIYGPDDPIPEEQQTTSKEQKEPEAAPTAQKDESFAYQPVDQSKTLTTPRLGDTSTSRTKLIIRQNNAMALASSPATNVKARIPSRNTTETGSLLWTNPMSQPQPDQTGGDELASDLRTATTTLTTQASNETETNAAITYGTQAIPLREAGSIDTDRRWGFFLTGTTGFGSDELQADSGKAKTVTAGFTAGADYRLASQSYVGLALTYVHSSFTTGNFGDLRSNSASLSLYGTTAYATHGYVDGYISAGYLTMDSERTILAGANTTQRANGSPDGFQFSGKAETGYDIKQASLTYGPFAGFRLAYADFGSFTEKDAGNFNLKVRGFNNLSAIGSLGVNGTHRYVMSNGGVLLPAMRLGYNHEFGDDRSNIKAEFVNLANSGFTTKSNKRSRDWINITPSVTASLPNDWTFTAQYEHDFFRDDVNENIFNLVAQYKW